jgi:hypothetical protein
MPRPGVIDPTPGMIGSAFFGRPGADIARAAF